MRPPSDVPTGLRILGGIGEVLSKYALIFALIAIILIFSFLRPETYPTIGNFGSIMQGSSSIVLVSFALLIPLITGHFDLSVATMAGFGGVFATGLLSFGIISSWPLAVLLVAVVGAVVGLVNGMLVALLKLHSLVVTLGTQTLLFGAILWFSRGQVIYQDIPAGFLALGQSRPFGIPIPLFFSVAVAVILWFILYYRPIGRKLYAIGGSEEAARLTGISVEKSVIGAFVAGGILAGMAGVVQVAQVGSASPTSGAEFLLPAIAAAFLGETSIRRGFYNVWGTFFAVYVLAAGTSGLYMLGADNWVQPAFNGSVLILAVILAKISAERSGRAKSHPVLSLGQGKQKKESGGPPA